MLEQLIALARRAGDEIMAVYESDFTVSTKSDESPLTQADLRSHHLIAAGLAQMDPGIPVVSEESELPDFSERSAWSRYWIVDPLDGTKEFINRNGEFTVNIALIENHLPLLGVVAVPALGRVYSGDVKAGVARRYDDARNGQGPREIKVRAVNEHLRVVGSRRHGAEQLQAYLDGLRQQFQSVELVSVGSSLKLCVLAEGEADLYPRMGPTSEWDIAAAQAVLMAAGGGVLDHTGVPFEYNRKASILNQDFLALGDLSYGWEKFWPKTNQADS